MEIVEIFEDSLYSMRYDGCADCIYDELLDKWNNVEYISEFIIENIRFLDRKVWSAAPTPENAIRQILEEAEYIEDTIEKLSNNAKNGEIPNLDSMFQLLGGKYMYELVYTPMKSYGKQPRSLIRLYAIKIDKAYLIVDGGIKLSDTIQNSPDLKEHVIKNIDNVRTWLKRNGIMDLN